MPSEWVCRILGEQFGPLKFDQLVELVRAGTLGEEDLVCEQGSSHWQPARTVVGLFHTARAAPVAAKQASSSDAETSMTGQTAALAVRESGTKPQRRSTGRLAGVIIASAVAVLGVVAWRLWRRATLRFPRPTRLAERASDELYFLGTGPWSTWEYVLLWIDALLVIVFVVFVIRRMIQRSTS